jgi:hypothetical protein
VPRKVFTREVLSSADVNELLMDQAFMRFDSAAQRAVEIPTPAEGMLTYLEDVNRAELFVVAGATGAWVEVFGATSAPTEVIYQSGWAGYTEPTIGFVGLRYWKRGGVVTVSGAIQAGAAIAGLAPICTLPAGFRPPAAVQAFPVDFHVLPSGVVWSSSARASGYIASISATFVVA